MLIEIGSFLGGVLSAYAKKKNWSKPKSFTIISFSIFILGALYVVFFPSNKSVWVGLLIFAVVGGVAGLIAVFLMFFEEWYENRNLHNHE